MNKSGRLNIAKKKNFTLTRSEEDNDQALTLGTNDDGCIRERERT